MKYDFNITSKRRNTNSLKWDVLENELPMWVADMDFESYPKIKEAIIEHANIGAYGYSIVPKSFFESYAKWWERRHKITLNEEWMIYSSGIVACISSVVRKLSTIAENVVVLSPVYNIFYNSIINNGRNVLCSNLIYDGKKYQIDYIDLENKLANPQTSLFILCNPHNPIGYIWSKEELTKIGSLCKKYNVLIIDDEIHCDLVDPGKEYVPFLSLKEFNDITITCISPSKTFNVAGMQSACIVVPNPYIRHKVWRALNTDEVGEPNFFAVAATIAAYKDGDEWLDQLREYLYNNKQYVKEYLTLNLPHLKLITKDATYLLWIDISYYSLDSVTFCKNLRHQTGLYISDGEEYGENGKSFVRINIATSLDNVKDGMNRLKAFIKWLENSGEKEC